MIEGKSFNLHEGLLRTRKTIPDTFTFKASSIPRTPAEAVNMFTGTEIGLVEGHGQERLESNYAPPCSLPAFAVIYN